MADIPLPQPETQDIYSLGFDKSLNRGIDSIQSPTVYDQIGAAVNTGQVLSGGNVIVKTLSIGGLVRQVAPGDDIQAAIDAVNREGGGTVQLLAGTYLINDNLELRTRVALAGAGEDITVLNFEGRTYAVRAVGTASAILTNIRISDLTVTQSGGVAGIEIDYCDSWLIRNVRSTDCTFRGFRIDHSQRFAIVDSLADNNATAGFVFDGDSTRETMEYQVSNCVADTNGTDGFIWTESNSQTNTNFTVIGAVSKNNVSDGFAVGTSSNNSAQAAFVSCSSSGNGADGYRCTNTDLIFVCCFAINNVMDGFDCSPSSTYVACVAEGNTDADFNIDVSTAVNLVACSPERGTGIAPSSKISVSSERNNVSGNYGGSTMTNREVVHMQNTSGTTLPTGAVVVFKRVAAGDQITTTPTSGDKYVFGMNTASLANNSYGGILTRGFTNDLLVDGTVAIAVGDFLCAGPSATYAAVATGTGTMVFAVALEALTSGTGVIDALLITPRMV